ncbi:MAG TPA: VOC family protein [Opitutales bacterium]|nr:VOC family protein [Opitutales bacterium]
MQIVEFAFVCYCVTDLPRAREFYEKVLGFQPAMVYGDDKKAWVEYEVGPHTLAITNMADDWKPSSDGASVAFEVGDFAAAIAELKAKNVQFAIEPTETPVCRMAIICDPDGSKICIHQRKR